MTPSPSAVMVPNVVTPTMSSLAACTAVRAPVDREHPCPDQAEDEQAFGTAEGKHRCLPSFDLPVISPDMSGWGFWRIRRSTTAPSRR